MTEHKKERAIKIYIYGLLTFASFALLLVTFWTFYTPKLIEQSPKPFPLVGSHTAEQGGTITYEYNYCKFTDKQAVVTKQFVDGLIFQSQDTATVLEQGCGHVHRDIAIPKTLPPGTYYLKITATYHINPIRDEKVVNATEKFTVTRAAIGAYGDASNDYITPTN